ncbi:amino acid ABC transporter permease [Loigolactobacillus coryniformis]|jgi:putative glutamine transport system permease protein|uniref:Glutamine ABC superfamily ATP binding cassette transporter, membrane protein n=5 Tax=Loigolactobacillus coryniformis TaxID=1610 RepID=J2Z4W8_9LACO|nr:amino acid ABC transporter permease [Loigolactobacillus coryniformis]MDT3391231.1 amino acid ABC transporter permease [Bacillota bacterium]OEH89324.1 glutamine ABC transporter permease [Loigolactobacillus coryniformis subsp. coryniformis]RRG05033.1 MAG: amino acid ABC transporter permease [Lactobacillus sp.]ATO44297.1 glutamine ABC transporter permease [Loigolactobacillus coryniformis subsp. torquens DSM 20004 = KCTC 3535]ATO55985.1 glutamine ABC transporter permease [Loigolactobacillus cor
MNNFIQAYSWLNIRYLLEGLWITVEISAISIVLSFIIGGLLGLLRYVKIKYLSALVGFVIDIIRNLPLLLILFFTFFGLPNIGIKPDVVMAAILAMTVFESAMVAEIIRSGIQAVDPGQMEAARSNGMSYRQAMQHIILPQAIKKMIPPLVSQFVSLIKDTSLATIIMLPELMYHAQIIYGQNTNFVLPMFLALAVLYFIVCYALSWLSRVLDRRMGA